MKSHHSPSAVSFACAYTMDVMPFEIVELAFFRRSADVDELLLKPQLDISDRTPSDPGLSAGREPRG
jgi:hypothetical protein